MSIQTKSVPAVEFTTLVKFARLVADSEDSEKIFSLLARAVVRHGAASHALVFGIGETGDFVLQASEGLPQDAGACDTGGAVSVAELHEVTRRLWGERFEVHAFALISEARLFGALIAMWAKESARTTLQESLVEGLSELTAISLAKAYQQRRLQIAFDDLRESQDAMVRTEKIRALGQMAAGIAHDLRNLLNPLVLYCDEVREFSADPRKVLELVTLMDGTLMRGLETVERLRAFSRQSPEERDGVPTDLNSMAREAIALCKSQLSGVQLLLKLGSPPLVILRPSDCVTAVVNLIVNAVEAMGGRGTIRVTTGGSDGGGFIEVKDNGPGIPSHLKDKIGEPFFTTKGESGTGLGIAIVQSFAERYGGRLIVESDAGEGASFVLWFPPGPP